MRVLLDYRPALRDRTGVGEYVFQLAHALVRAYPPDAAGTPLALTLFSSSWKDRPRPDAALAAAAIVDRRVPVRVLNAAWHRLGWPPAETIARGRFDVVHSPHPLLLPSRDAARVITVHDLFFLSHPEGSTAEVRRDYPSLVRRHAERADRIVVPSASTARDVQEQLHVPGDRISICPHGRPDWEPRRAPPTNGYILFLGTLEPRKNVGGLLDAYERLLDPTARGRGDGRIPPLVLAGRAVEGSAPWLARILEPPLAGHVRHVGYVDPERRRELYEGACLLVQPSLEEGFGLPVLEAMTVGVPVVAAHRGALPDVLGDAGLLVDPVSRDRLADAMDRLLTDPAAAAAYAARGIARSRHFDWLTAARCVYAAYQCAIERRRCGSA